jgi:glycosyltransferase involved in cell wall biosynthesis
MARYILVGADPSRRHTHHGGVLTLSKGLLSHVARHGHSMDVINTLRVDSKIPPLRVRLTGGIVRVREMFQALRAREYDGAVIISGAGFGFLERIILAALCRARGVTTVFVIVDGWFPLVRQRSFAVRAAVRRLLRIPNLLGASGARWVELFKELGVETERILLFHYWLPETFRVAQAPRSAVAGRPMRFVFVGWMLPEKGIHELLAAIGDLRKRHTFQFTFVGGGTLLQHVQTTIAEAGWSETVAATGWMPSDQFQELLSESDVFVLPTHAEGFPMALIEALSKGLPVISTDVGGIADSLRDGVNGYLIPPKAVAPLVEAMERYIENPNLIVEHSRAALRIVRANHDADTNCALILTALA